MKFFSIQHLLDWLISRGLLHDRARAEAYLLCTINVPPPLASYHFIIQCSAWIVTGLIFWQLLAQSLFSLENKNILLASGLLLIAFSSFFNHSFYYSCSKSLLVVQEFLTAFSIVGKIIFTLGFMQLSLPIPLPITKGWMISLGLTLISLPSYFLTSSSVDRYCSITFCLLSFLINVLIQYQSNVAFFVFFLTQLIIISAMLTWKNRETYAEPLLYSCFTALGASALILSTTFHPLINNIMPLPVIPPLIFNSMLTLSILCFILYKTGGLEALYELKIISACVGLILVTFISNTGILLSLGLLIISYDKHQRALSALAILLLIFFMGEFYYSLADPISTKAVFMFISGITLLCARLIMRYKHWDVD